MTRIAAAALRQRAAELEQRAREFRFRGLLMFADEAEAKARRLRAETTNKPPAAGPSPREART